jgi:NAD(P)H dehydrogenase (quinone)
MTKVLIIYASDYGSTQKMAEAVAAGVETVENAKAQILQAEDVKQEDLLASNAVIVGTPTHMGSPDWRIKQFIDQVCGPLWMKDALVGKVAAVFGTASGFGSSGGGSELTLLTLLSNFAELGMILIPLPKNTPGFAKAGLQWGPCARTGDENLTPIGVSDEKLEAARHHGANVARAAMALKDTSIFRA